MVLALSAWITLKPVTHYRLSTEGFGFTLYHNYATTPVTTKFSGLYRRENEMDVAEKQGQINGRKSLLEAWTTDQEIDRQTVTLNLDCILALLLWFSDDRGLGLNVFWEHASSKYSDLKPSYECFSNWSLVGVKTLLFT